MGKYDALTPILNSSESRTTIEPPGKTRPLAKSRNSEYRQISVYIRRSVHDEALRRLIGGPDDFSDLVNRLVAAWVDTGARSS
jgi:hypothetical protein